MTPNLDLLLLWTCSKSCAFIPFYSLLFPLQSGCVWCWGEGPKCASLLRYQWEKGKHLSISRRGCSHIFSNMILKVPSRDLGGGKQQFKIAKVNKTSHMLSKISPKIQMGILEWLKWRCFCVFKLEPRCKWRTREELNAGLPPTAVDSFSQPQPWMSLRCINTMFNEHCSSDEDRSDCDHGLLSMSL